MWKSLFRYLAYYRQSTAISQDPKIGLGGATYLANEQGQERIDVLGSSGRVVDLFIIRVGVSDTNGLIQEDDVGLVGPAVLVVCDVDLGILVGLGDLARTKFEQQTGS